MAMFSKSGVKFEKFPNINAKRENLSTLNLSWSNIPKYKSARNPGKDNLWKGFFRIVAHFMCFSTISLLDTVCQCLYFAHELEVYKECYIFCYSQTPFVAF